jgi:predicted ArsR family transcriptional regulator
MPGTGPLHPSDQEWQISAVAALNEPVRRNLYRYVVAQTAPVGRDEAAGAAGVSRELAAFHLDKLVDLGLLEVEYRRLSGRQGPGAGRPAKLYRPSARQLDLTFPERRYELVAHLMARAFDGTDDPRDGLDRAARQFGEDLGEEARRPLGRRPSPDRLLDQACAVLQGYGFDPIQIDGEVRLRNCPFDALANEHRDLVCGMNLAILEGLVTGLRATTLHARLAPEAGWCCVVLGPAA